MKNVEILMISIDWESSDKYSNIIESIRPLKSTIKEDEYNTNEYDIITYYQEDYKYFQVCIKTPYTPILKVNEKYNRNNSLFKIKDNLWIIKEKWKKNQKGTGYHYCPSINTVGKLEIGITKEFSKIDYFISINIHSSINNFDFEQLKNDFDGELWNLITSKKSKVHSDRIELRYGDKIFRYPESKLILDFLKFYDLIAQKPKTELFHSKAIVKTEKVKPIAETYRKLVTMGYNARVLPSKLVDENYDIYENRYVCLMLYNIYKILLNNIKYTEKQLISLNNRIEEKESKIEILNDPKPKVNKEDVLAEINFQEEKVRNFEQKWQEISRNMSFNEGSKFSSRTIQINYQHYRRKNAFFCETKENKNILINFPDQCVNFLENNQEYLIEFYGRNEDKYLDKKGKEYSHFTITGIRKIESNKEKNILENMKENMKQLEQNDWVKILTDKDKKERDNQVKTLRKDIEKLKFQINNLGIFIDEQQFLLPLIEQRIKKTFFKTIKWQNLARFTPSMTFIQNLNYRNILNLYQEILKSEGIEIEVFDLYEKAITYGIREMPQVYELWCLISTIKTLTESYHFQHNLRDIHELLKVINPDSNKFNQEVIFNFNGDLKGRKVILYYQKTLPNGKRPDFLLEITIQERTIYVILDAKFKNYKFFKSLSDDLDLLRSKYQENDNYYVFILHPCNDLKDNNQIIKMTNYGGERIDKSEELPFHQYGYINHKPNISDNLKKLMGMAFEYLLDNKSAIGKDAKPTYKLFCLNCGGKEIMLKTHSRGDNRYYYTAICQSENCGHETPIDYCWNCGTKLFKHGFYWDYHKTSIWSSFDIHCPKCGMTLADKP